MANVSLSNESLEANPIDVVERMVDENEWFSERRSDGEMSVQAPGQWCDYSLYFAWNKSASAMHFTCAFEARVPPEKRATIYELLARINERIWLGHFALCDDEGMPMYRYTMLLGSGGRSTNEQIQDLLEVALEECERFYPAFQHVIWAGKNADDAIAAAILDPIGEA
jgi:hypothetical protein